MMALVIPAVQRARDAASRVECQNHLKQVGLALHQYHNSHKVLPPGCSYQNGNDPYPYMSWCTRLLPYLEQEGVWRQAEQAYSQASFFVKNPPHTGLTTVMPIFLCPADSRTNASSLHGQAFTAFLGVEGTDWIRKDGVLFLDSKVRFADIADGLSNTLMVGERPPSADEHLGWWYAGWGQNQTGSCDMILGVQEINVANLNCSPGRYAYGPGRLRDQCDLFHFWSLHFGGGANFLIADGSVRLIPYSAAEIMPALATRAGGELIPELP